MLWGTRHLRANVFPCVRVTVREGLVCDMDGVRDVKVRHQGLQDVLLQHLMGHVMGVMTVVVVRGVMGHVMVTVAVMMAVVVVAVVVTVHVRTGIARSSRGELLVLRISEGRATGGTEMTVLIGALEARAVHGVTAGQECNGLATVEHPLLGGTARTLGLEAYVHLALMRVLDLDGQTHAALVAVPVVNVQPLAHATYPAVVAVVDALALLIVPQLAHLAVVVCHGPRTVLVGAHLTYGLDRVALHAHHLLGRVAAHDTVSMISI